jgi:hypothetical protein
MSTLIEKINSIKSALEGILPAVYHYGGGAVKDQYIEWMEDGEGDPFYHDNTKEQTLSIAVNYYAIPQKVWEGDIPDKIQAVLKSFNDPKCRLESVNVEYLSEKTTSTKYVHFRWSDEI